LVRLQAGLAPEGASDLIGGTPIIVTPAMVGSKIFVFTALEVKTETGGDGSPEQKDYVRFVQKRGGIAGVVKSDAEALKIIADYTLQGANSAL